MDEMGCERCARVTGHDGYALPVTRIHSMEHDNKSMVLCEQCLRDALANLANEGLRLRRELERRVAPMKKP